MLCDTIKDIQKIAEKKKINLFYDALCFVSFRTNTYGDIFVKSQTEKVKINISQINDIRTIHYLVKTLDGDFKKYEGTMIDCGYVHRYITPLEQTITEREVINVWRYISKNRK